MARGLCVIWKGVLGLFFVADFAASVVEVFVHFAVLFFGYVAFCVHVVLCACGEAVVTVFHAGALGLADFAFFFAFLDAGVLAVDAVVDLGFARVARDDARVGGGWGGCGCVRCGICL